MRNLTDRQARCLRFIIDYTAANGMAPTRKEMMNHLEIHSKNSVGLHILALEKKGFITTRRFQHRSIVVDREKAQEFFGRGA